MSTKEVWYGRYNPSKKKPRYPFQFKNSRLGRAYRSNTIASSGRLRRKIKARDGEWVKLETFSVPGKVTTIILK